MRFREEQSRPRHGPVRELRVERDARSAGSVATRVRPIPARPIQWRRRSQTMTTPQERGHQQRSGEGPDVGQGIQAAQSGIVSSDG